jgi:sulfate/thiosulfate transport system substrate-binding protein
VAEAYLDYLYGDEGQRDRGASPLPATVPASRKARCLGVPRISLFTVDEIFGGWQDAHACPLRDGGVFDQIYTPGR